MEAFGAAGPSMRVRYFLRFGVPALGNVLPASFLDFLLQEILLRKLRHGVDLDGDNTLRTLISIDIESRCSTAETAHL